MTTHRTVLTATLAAAAAAAAITTLPAAGHDAKPSGTLTFATTQGKGDEVSIDERPRGESVGDRFLVSSTLRRAGELAGRLEGDCVGLDARYEALDCSLTIILRDGLLTAKGAATSKPVPGVGRTTEQYAITGGTGAYAGAAGAIRRTGEGDRDTLTVTFSG
jgi:allene oxide cyclase-like protein